MGREKILVVASVASMIDQFNMHNIRLMQRMGYEVHVACNFREGNTCDAARIKKLQKKLREMGVRYHPWDCPRDFAVRKCYRAYRQLLGLTKRHHFAWMHCHSPIGGALARLVAHRRKIGAIYTAHGFHFYAGAPLKHWLLYYPVEKMLSGWTDVLVTVNKEDFRFAKRHLRAKQVWRIPGVGVDTGHFCNYRPSLSKEQFCRKYGLPADAKILLSVGELSRRKNHQFVIRTLPKLDAKACYLLCGQGRLQGYLAALAQKEGVGERVRMLGYVEDLREVYAHADVFVFPSLQEGLPVALVEALSCGLPCLVSDIRGNRELVGKSCRFRLGAKQGFLRQLAAMLEHPYPQGQERAQVAEYDTRAVEQKLLFIYREMEKQCQRRDMTERPRKRQCQRQAMAR